MMNNSCHLSRFKVEINHCDAYKIVHNSQYFVWFDCCIFNKIMEGRDLSTIEKKPYRIIKSRCRYIHSASYLDNLLVKTSFKINNNLVNIKQYMFNEDTNNLISICNSLIEINLKGAIVNNEGSFIKQ